MKKIVVIPARLESTRLPGKILLDLQGKTVIQRVYEQCLKCKAIDDVFIATDSEGIKERSELFTDNIILTSKDHQSGTDRIAEAAAKIDCDIVINVQGDEPFIDPDLIDELVEAFGKTDVMVSAVQKIQHAKDLVDPNVVKVTKDFNGYALYFSRSVIPFPRDLKFEWNPAEGTKVPEGFDYFKHIGIYGYKKDFLLSYAGLQPSQLEQSEKLEQLRALENGYRIKLIETEVESLGIDTQEDYEKAKRLLDEN